LGERAYIDPREAEKLRSSDHTREEVREVIQERNMIQEEEEKDKAKHREKTIREMESKPEDPEIHELQERQLEPEKFLTKEEREERDRESI